MNPETHLSLNGGANAGGLAPRPAAPTATAAAARFEAALSPRWRACQLFCIRLKCLAWRVSSRFTELAKRAFDVVISAYLIALFGPLMLLIAFLVRRDGGPVIFAQTRVGYRGRLFRMFKFRSMCVDAEAKLAELMKQNQLGSDLRFKLDNDPRITRVGRFLRKTSLDELPQLFNVFRGDMTLVGPRPPVPREVALYTLADRRRLEHRPGITCLWQVGERKGGLLEIGDRNQIEFEEQVELDVRYIENQSFWKDLVILVKTLPAMLLGK